MSLSRGLCRERKHLGLVQIYHSSCQKNLFSCNINRPRDCGRRDGICFCRGDGLAVRRLPVKQVMLFTSRSLNHKQMFYLKSQSVVYSAQRRRRRCRPPNLLPSSSFPARARSACVCSAHLNAASARRGNKNTPDRKLYPVM